MPGTRAGLRLTALVGLAGALTGLLPGCRLYCDRPHMGAGYYTESLCKHPVAVELRQDGTASIYYGVGREEITGRWRPGRGFTVEFEPDEGQAPSDRARRFLAPSVIAIDSTGPVDSISITPLESGYSIVKIEVAIARERKVRGETAYTSEALPRFAHAGPAALPELAWALDSEERWVRNLAGRALRSMTEHRSWPEAYSFVTERAGSTDCTAEEAAELLYAAAHDGFRGRVDMLPLAASVLDRDDHIARIVLLSSRSNRVEWRLSDAAALVIQAVTGEDLGADIYVRSDEAIGNARAWVAENMASVEGEQKRLKYVGPPLDSPESGAD